MKIGLVVDDSLERPDGVQQYVLTLGSWLSANGHDVCYISSGEVLKGIDGHYSASKNVSVRYNKNRLSIPLPALKSRLARIAREEKFDVLHLQMPFNPWLSSRLANACGTGTAVVATFHILPYSALHSALTKQFLKLQSKTISRLDKIICVSEPARKFLAGCIGAQTEVIPNMIDIKRFYPLLNQDAKRLRVVTLGRLVERKGVKFLISAFAELDPDLKDKTELIIAGKGPLLKQLKEYARKKRVKALFIGFIKESDKPELLASATVAAFPSTGGESFGIVLLEAMAAGSGAVVGGDNPGYRSVLRPAGMLIQPQNTRGFARLLAKLLKDEQFRGDVHRAQSQLVKHYDVVSVGPKILGVYKEAIAKRAESRNN